MARRGDLYWIAADVLRPSRSGVPHPYVVVSEDVFNASRLPVVVVCALTSQLRKANEPGAVLLDDGEGGLPARSVVVPTQVCSVDKADLGAFIGRLEAARVDRIVAGLGVVQRSTR